MRNLISLLVLLFVFNSSFSQFIEGKVIDAQTEEPINGVHVYIKGVGNGTQTNSLGKFRLNTSFEEKGISVSFSHISYFDKIVLVEESNFINVSLNKKTELLNEVKITHTKYLNKSIAYKKLSQMKNGLHSFGATYFEGKIYVVGGNASYHIDDMKKTLENYPDLYDFEQYLNKAKNSYWKKLFNGDYRVYDILKDEWNYQKDKFEDRAHHKINIWNNQLYVIGGLRLTRTNKREYLQDNIEILNFENDSTIIDYTNPHQAVDFSMNRYKDNLILMGGSVKLKRNGFKEYSNKVHLYNLSSGLWYEIGAMPVAKECNSVLVNDKIFVIGGFNKKPHSSIESFNITSQKWKKEGELFSTINKPALTSKNEMIYIFDNGKLSTLNTLTNELHEYFIDLYLINSEMLLIDNKLYIIGGLRANSFSATPSSGIYSININEFEKTLVHKSKFI